MGITDARGRPAAVLQLLVVKHGSKQRTTAGAPRPAGPAGSRCCWQQLRPTLLMCRLLRGGAAAVPCRHTRQISAATKLDGGGDSN